MKSQEDGTKKKPPTKLLPSNIQDANTPLLEANTFYTERSLCLLLGIANVLKNYEISL